MNRISFSEWVRRQSGRWTPASKSSAVRNAFDAGASRVFSGRKFEYIYVREDAARAECDGVRLAQDALLEPEVVVTCDHCGSDLPAFRAALGEVERGDGGYEDGRASLADLIGQLQAIAVTAERLCKVDGSKIGRMYYYDAQKAMEHSERLHELLAEWRKGQKERRW